MKIKWPLMLIDQSMWTVRLLFTVSMRGHTQNELSQRTATERVLI